MNNKHSIKIMNWNCNGISGKSHQLEVALNQHKPDIFALTETKLIPCITDKEICINYTPYRLDRTGSVGRGGGVLIGVLDSSNIVVTQVLPAETGELLSIVASVGGFSFDLTVYYHRPSVRNVDDFITWCKNESSCRQVIVGDFNLPDIDWTTCNLKKRQDIHMHESFLTCIDSTDLQQHVKFPTHRHGNTLDLVLSNLDLSTPTSQPSCSDHDIILFDLFSEDPVSHTNENNNTTPFLYIQNSKYPSVHGRLL